MENKIGRQVTLFQGSSKVTEKKSDDLYGLIKMRLTQNQGKWISKGLLKHFVIADIFCGEGYNIVDDKLILGSPLRIIQAIKETKLSDRLKSFDVVFSDIRQSAIDMIVPEVKESGLNGNVNFHLYKSEAREMIKQLSTYLAEKKGLCHAILVLDPNGPKQLPLDEIVSFSELHSKQCDIIVNLSVTAFKRIIGHKHGKGFDSYNDWWINYIDDLDELANALGGKHKGIWMRENIKGTYGWSIFACFAHSQPKNDWAKAGFSTYENARLTWTA